MTNSAPIAEDLITTGARSFDAPTDAEWAARVEVLSRVLGGWLAEETGYDEEAGPELKAALNNNRRNSGERLLFPADE